MRAISRLMHAGTLLRTFSTKPTRTSRFPDTTSAPLWRTDPLCTWNGQPRTPTRCALVSRRRRCSLRRLWHEQSNPLDNCDLLLSTLVVGVGRARAPRPRPDLVETPGWWQRSASRRPGSLPVARGAH